MFPKFSAVHSFQRRYQLPLPQEGREHPSTFGIFCTFWGLSPCTRFLPCCLQLCPLPCSVLTVCRTRKPPSRSAVHWKRSGHVTGQTAVPAAHCKPCHLTVKACSSHEAGLQGVIARLNAGWWRLSSKTPSGWKADTKEQNSAPEEWSEAIGFFYMVLMYLQIQM